MSDILLKIKSCEVCGCDDLYSHLNLGLHPMCDDLVPIGDKRICKSFPIEIVFCKKCTTAHQLYQIPKKELFPPAYHYRSRLTVDVLNGMRQLVETCAAEIGNLNKLKVLDIGCNDGSLLSFFKQEGAKTYGIEPTDAAYDALRSGHDVINDFLDEKVARAFVLKNGNPDLITFTNVFAHIEDLKGVLEALKILSGPNTLIVIENHYLGSVLEKNQFDTFYHEHPRTYSYSSFIYIAKDLGMAIKKVEFPQRYGGNIRVFLGPLRVKQYVDNELLQKESFFDAQLKQLSLGIDIWRKKKLSIIQYDVRCFGKLPAKAFPGRAAIPITILALNENQISAVYEKPGSAKIGHYVPGTRIPILSDDQLNDAAGPLINLAWHISKEIRAYLKDMGCNRHIIDIIEQSDFISS